MFLVYGGIQFQQIKQVSPEVYALVQPYLLANTICLGLFGIVHIILAFKLYIEFGWKIYKKLGPDPQIKGKDRNNISSHLIVYHLLYCRNV